jgi:hypothetical protein
MSEVNGKPILKHPCAHSNTQKQPETHTHTHTTTNTHTPTAKGSDLGGRASGIKVDEGGTG